MKDADIMYGLMHPYEFVSQTFGSESFRTLLADIPPTENFSASNWILALWPRWRWFCEGESTQLSLGLTQHKSTGRSDGTHGKLWSDPIRSQWRW